MVGIQCREGKWGEKSHSAAEGQEHFLWRGERGRVEQHIRLEQEKQSPKTTDGGIMRN